MITVYSQGPTTERLMHREFNVDDAQSFFKLASDPVINRYTGETPLESLEAARLAIENYPDFKTIGFGRWACVLKATETVIGFCGLKYLQELDEVDVGYRLMPDYWGQGLATEACQATIKFGFEVIGLEKIIGLVEPENHASIRVLEKCGLKGVENITFGGTPALKYTICR